MPRAPDPAGPLCAPDAFGITAMETSAKVLDLTRMLGFAAAGICAVQPTTYAAEYARWIARGEHGDMQYLAAQAEKRMDPRREHAGAQTMLMVLDQYAERGHTDAPLEPQHGRVARYARGRDYHTTVKTRLHRLADTLRARWPEHQFRSFADSAPILEREHAARAGLGWVGKHTLLINPRLGSYFVLGGMLTTMDWHPTADAADSGPAGPSGTPSLAAAANIGCGSCTRCIDACPTQAISPYSVNAAKCISYLTIEQLAATASADGAKLGDWLYGCDICQEVCPHNSARAWPTPRYAEHAERVAQLNLQDVAAWTAADKAKVVEGTPMRRTKLAKLHSTAHAMLSAQASGPHPVRE